MKNKEIELRSLDLYWDENNEVYGYDKEGNEYALNERGEVVPMPQGSIDIMWGGCPKDYALEIQQKLRSKAAK